MTSFDISNLTCDIYRYDSGLYCARFSYPDDNGDILSVNFEFSHDCYVKNSSFLSFFTEDKFLANSYKLSFLSVGGHPSVFLVDLPTCYGYLSSRGKWLRSGSHHTVLYIDFEKLFAF